MNRQQNCAGRGICVLGIAILLVFGCKPQDKRSIVCFDPVDGQTITNADDINAAMPGIQIEVGCLVNGFSFEDSLTLNVQNPIDGSGRDYTMFYDGTGEVWFGPVTLQGGPSDSPAEYTLVATGDDGDVNSAPVHIDVVAELSCPSFDWLEPMDTEVWIQDDDADDDPSNGFQHDVIITTDAGPGEDVTLYINDALVDSTTVDGTLITFANVTFPSGVTDMNLRIQTTEACSSSALVHIDMDVPLCNITAPVATIPAGWLNSTHDVSTEDGMQVNITVETEDSATVELFVDTPLTAEATDITTALSSGNASFDETELPEADFGVLTLQVRCTDTGGNLGISTLNTSGVDSVLPDLSITSPAGGEHYNDDADVNTSLPGIQIEVAILTDQPAGSVVNVYACDGGAASTLVPEGIGTVVDGGIAIGQVHLGGVDGDIDLCTVITKASGNATVAGPITVYIDTAMPQVQIVDPDGTTPILNIDDEDAADGCQYTVIAECDSIGFDVRFFDEVLGELGTGATCVADSGSSLGGTASLQVTLPDGDRVIYAQHTDGAGNSSESSHVSIVVHSTLPVVEWDTPSSCPWTLYSAGSFIRMVRVASDESPVTLSVTDGTGAHVGGSPYSADVSGAFASFSSVEFAHGENFMSASASDSYGQEGSTTTCAVTVTEERDIDFTSPIDGSLIGMSGDLDEGLAGCQVDVSFTTDILSGDDTELIVDSVSQGHLPYGGTEVEYPSITIPEGDSISLEACATDELGTGCHAILVSCDVTPPDTITTLTSSTLDRRGGVIELSWDAPGDGGDPVDGYEIVCDEGDIVDVGTFEAADPYTFAGTVGAPGTGQTHTISGLLLERTHYCSVRGVDLAGNVGIPATSTSQTLAFLRSDHSGATGSLGKLGWSVAAVGDVNGDHVDDVIAGSQNRAAYIFFGSSVSLPTVPDVTITEDEITSQFGSSVGGIGYFDDDDIADIAIGDFWLGLRGAAYIFLGRSTWTSGMDASDADLIFVLEDPLEPTNDDSAEFGRHLEPAGDFNGDGRDDLLVSAAHWSDGNGAVFVLLGRASPTSGTTITIPGDRSTGLVGDFMIASPLVGSLFGDSIALAGSIDGDSYSDVLIGAPGVDSGYAFLLNGRAATSSGLSIIATPGTSLVPPGSDQIRFGHAVAGIGDIDGDSCNDVAVSAVTYPAGVDNQGAVFVYLNETCTGPDSVHDIVITNDASSSTEDRLGNCLLTSVSPFLIPDFDINGDGLSDLVFSGQKYDDSFSPWFVQMGLLTGTSVTAGNSEYLLGPMADAGASNTGGRVCSSAGDINDDGYMDLVFGYPYHQASDGGFAILY